MHGAITEAVGAKLMQFVAAVENIHLKGFFDPAAHSIDFRIAVDDNPRPDQIGDLAERVGVFILLDNLPREADGVFRARTDFGQGNNCGDILLGTSRETRKTGSGDSGEVNGRRLQAFAGFAMTTDLDMAFSENAPPYLCGTIRRAEWMMANEDVKRCFRKVAANNLRRRWYHLHYLDPASQHELNS
jgi:hypothetical protein